MIDLIGQTTQVALITAVELTTTAPDAYTSAPIVDTTPLMGKAMVLLNTGGGGGTGAQLITKIQTSPGSQYLATMTGTETSYAIMEIADGTRTTCAVKVTPTSKCSFKELYLRLKKQGTADGAVTVQIMTDNSGKPSNTVVDQAATLSAAAMSTDYAWVKATFATLPELTSGTAYHFAIMGAYSANADNNVMWGGVAAASGGTYTFYTNSWSNAVTTVKPQFQAVGYSWTDAETTTATAGSGLTVIAFDTEATTKPVIRGFAQCSAGDSDTSFRVSSELVGVLHQGV